MIHFANPVPALPLAHVLTLDHVDTPVGYSIGGFQSGPELVAMGHGMAAGAVYERLMRIESLNWLRGRLTMLELDAIPDLQADTLSDIVQVAHIDEIVMLANPVEGIDMVSDGYWKILEACADLGMISGRGVPRCKNNSLQIVS